MYFFICTFLLFCYVCVRGLGTTLIESAILLHVTNVFISLPALFINAKFPLCVKISGVVDIYFVLGAGYPYDVLLQG